MGKKAFLFSILFIIIIWFTSGRLKKKNNLSKILVSLLLNIQGHKESQVTETSFGLGFFGVERCRNLFLKFKRREWLASSEGCVDAKIGDTLMISQDCSLHSCVAEGVRGDRWF